jgi:hypothetical protein
MEDTEVKINTRQMRYTGEALVSHHEFHSTGISSPDREL